MNDQNIHLSKIFTDEELEINEVFKDIPGYENQYQVSNLGNVKSLHRTYLRNGIYPAFKKEIMLKKCIDSTKYYIVTLCKNGKSKTSKVHKLVAMAFLNHEPNGYELVVNHKNFNKLDNRLCNLEIVTARDNCNKKHIKSSSKYTGVTWCKHYKKWKATIFINGRNKHLGYFLNEYEAHLKYEDALINLF